GLPVIAKGAGKTLGKGKKLTEEAVEFIAPTLKDIYSRSKSLTDKGVKIIGKEAQEALDSDSLNIAKQLIDAFRSQAKQGSKMIGEALSTDASPKAISEELGKVLKQVSQSTDEATLKSLV